MYGRHATGLIQWLSQIFVRGEIKSNGLSSIYVFVLSQWNDVTKSSLSVTCPRFGEQTIHLSPDSEHAAFRMDFLTSFYCNTTVAQLFDGLFDCSVIMKKYADRCHVGPLRNG